MAIEEAKRICRKCKRYDEKKRYCRRFDRIKHPDDECEFFEMSLADHYVPNVWDEWKQRKEREQK